MKAIRGRDLRMKQREYFELAGQGETLLIPRPNQKNLVLISENEYNELIKARQNAEYLSMLEKSRQELAEGKVVTMTMEQLEEMAK